MPVDIASGTVTLEEEDLSVPGHVPLIWSRAYSTAWLGRPTGPMGRGWCSRYDATLKYQDQTFEFISPEGELEVFDNPDGCFARGEVLRRLGGFVELFREGQRAIVRRWDVDSGDIWRYVFEAGPPGAAWPLASIEDVTGRQGVDLVWLADGRLTAVRQRLEGRQLVPHYDKAGYIDRVDFVAADGQRHPVARYAHDEQGQLIEARDAADFPDRYEYDPHGRLIREIVKDGGVFHYRYDGQGRCVLRTGLGHYKEKRFRYIDSIRTTEVTNSYGNTWIYQHLPTGQIVLQADPLGGQRRTEYDDVGRIVATIDANGGATRYGYDERGNRSSVTDALGHVTRWRFNEHHQPVAMIDVAGQAWMRAYDDQRRLVATMDPLDHRWRLAYDDDGNLAEIVNPKGNARRFSYQRGTLQRATDWIGNATHFERDGYGRVTERRGPLGEVTRLRHDVMGNVVQVSLPDGAQVRATYDHAGNLTHLVDAKGQVTRWRYGPCLRLLERTDALGGKLRFEWGTEGGRLEALFNQKGERYTFEYDDAGRVMREVGFDGGVRRFDLDAAGNTVVYTSAGEQVIRMERDALGRVVRQALPDGEQVSFGFDPLGRLVSAVNADIAVSFEHDVYGRVVRETQGEHVVSRQYDPTGHLLAVRSSLGHEADYAMDANGAMTALGLAGGHRVRFERDAAGREITRWMPGGVRMEQRYDLVGRLVSQRVMAPARGAANDGRDAGTSPAATELVNRRYRYDVNGNLIRTEDARWGAVDYECDPVDRLVAALQARGRGERFEYDANSNITRRQVDRADPASSSDDRLEYGPGDRLLRKGSTTYEYDADGRRIRMVEALEGGERREWRYEWNALDRLKAVTRPDGQRWTYAYDALARRVIKRISGGERQAFVWDGDVPLHHVRQDGSVNAWVFSEDDFSPLCRISGLLAEYCVNDQIGTPRELVGESGHALALGRNEAFGGRGGASDSGDSAAMCPVSFQGQWFDQENGFSYNRCRYYDADSFRYISEDPIGLRGGLNSSCYVVNPTGWIDPFGLCGKNGEEPEDAGAASRRPGFVVDSRGTAVRADPAAARADLERAGFSGTATTETSEYGTIHRNVPGADGPMDVRIMDGQLNGAPFKGPRVRTTRAGADNDGVRSDGSRFRNNEPKSQRLEESHIHLPR